MTHRLYLQTLVATLAAALALSACGGGSNAALPVAGTQSAPMAKASGPKPCTGQSTTSLFATSGTTTIAKSVPLCVPAFDGFGGTIELPASKPTVTAMLTSSTTNYNNLLPILTKKRKPIFYLQIQTSAGNTFGTRVRGEGALTGTKIVAGHQYTVYGQATTGSGGILHLIVNLGPCSLTAASGKDGGAIPGIGKLLEAQQLTNGPSAIIFELFDGKLASQPC